MPIIKSKYLSQLWKSNPAIAGFLKKRLARREPYGLRFTVGMLTCAFLLSVFIALARNVLIFGLLAEADIRIMNFAVSLREINSANIFLFITYLGNWQIIVSLGIIILLVLLFLGERRKALALCSAVLASEVLYSVFKMLIHRPRPDMGFSLISQAGYAFPSGHAVVPVVFYGMIAFFLRRSFKKRRQRLLAVSIATALIFFIGYSRIYLGAHWASDVFAGWALGLAILVFARSLFKAREKSLPEHKKPIVLSRLRMASAGGILLFLEAGFAVYFYLTHPIHIQAREFQPITVIPPNGSLETFILSKDFPKFSETLTGKKMAPVSLIFVGSRDALVGAFEEAGWSVADDWGVRTIVRLADSAIGNDPHPTAPVTPAFLNAEPETIAFQKPTEKNTARERHHTRFWLTNYRFGVRLVWAATASFDEEIQYLIAHKIDPNIDGERNFIKSEIMGTTFVDALHQIQLVPPLEGKNSIGDTFFTDGKAYIVVLK